MKTLGITVLAAIGLVAQASAEEPVAWVAERGVDKTTQQEVCLIRAVPGKIYDGHADAKIALVVTPQKVLIQTDSEIDLTYPGVGLQVGQRPLITIDALYKTQTAVVEKAYAELIDQFVKGKEVTIFLGFWPTWPVTQTQSAVFTLRGFRAAFQDFQACNNSNGNN